MVDEDNIDTEALQAQIDLSMSFAQTLVSSWLKPQKASTFSRKRNFEEELRDHMHRPPRLGVGAPIPDTQAGSREIARLRGQLAGKKRGRDEDVDHTKPQGSDVEEESRTGTIKRKIREDPFDVVHGKKKKKTNGKANGVLTPSPALVVTIESSQPETEETISNQANGIAGEPINVPSPKSGAKPQHSSPKEGGFNLRVISSSTTPPSSSSNPSNQLKLSSTPKSRLAVTEPVLSMLSTIPAPTSRVHLPPQILNESLLNLKPLLSEAESDDALPATSSSTSPRKKRKRRKKKNPVHDNSTSVTNPIS